MHRTIKKSQPQEAAIHVLTKDSVDWVHGHLVFSGVSDETLGVREADIGRRSSVPLVVSDDLDSVMLPHTDARVGGAEIDADRRPLALPCHLSRNKSQAEETMRDGEK